MSIFHQACHKETKKLRGSKKQQLSAFAVVCKYFSPSSEAEDTLKLQLS